MGINRLTKEQEIQYIIESVEKGMQDGYLELPEEDAIQIMKTLIKNGFSVLVSRGSIGDDLRLDWIYSGSLENLKYANSNNVILLSKDYQEDILWALEEYKENHKGEDL